MGRPRVGSSARCAVLVAVSRVEHEVMTRIVAALVDDWTVDGSDSQLSASQLTAKERLPPSSIVHFTARMTSRDKP